MCKKIYMKKILQRGAEAEIYLIDNKVVKNRIKKSYRIPELDEKIRKLRTRSETKLLEKAGKVILVPKLFSSDENTKKIIMEFVKGEKLSEHLSDFSLEKQKEICKKIGENVAKLHDAEIVHGDLTTSNMIYVDGLKKITSRNNITKNGFQVNSSFAGRAGGNNHMLVDENFKIYFIDFGLGFISQRFEDMAVDLHLLKEALEAKHFQHWEILFNEVLKGYKKSKNSARILEQFKRVEKRGRYKEQ